MRLRATVLREGKTRHLAGHAGSASAVSIERPTSLEIAEDAGAVYLLRLDGHGVCVADTWHEDVAAAKGQAQFEYGIGGKDWEPVG
jgi:hypothetical protein